MIVGTNTPPAPAIDSDVRRRNAGATLVDVLVGLVVGLVAIVVAYRAFAALDAVRRSATGASDASIAATFALDAIATRVANAGAGWSAAVAWLDTCPVAADFAGTLRPPAVVITDGGAPDRPDSIAIREARGAGAPIGAAFAAAATSGADFAVEASAGFAVGDRIVAVSRTGACATAEVTSRSMPAAGIVRLAHTPVAGDFAIGSVLLDLGPAGDASALRFDVSSGTLRSTDIANGDAPIPIAANVVDLKFRYGIDSDGDGALDTWVAADVASAWSASTVLAASRATLERVKAIRIGMIVRSDERDRTLRSPYHWVLFDCERADKATCPGRIEGTIAATAAGGYRYRSLETIVPLRNVAWNIGA